MVQVGTCVGLAQAHVFFQQILVDIDDATAREYLLELVALQLVVTGAAAHHHGANVQIVQGVGNPMKQHPVVSDDLVSTVKLPRTALRITTTQVTRWQHGLHAGVPQHRLRSQTDLTEQTLRAATREIEHRLGLRIGGQGVANDRHVRRVFNIQQGARCFLGQATRHLLVDEVDDLFFQRRAAHRRRWSRRLFAAQSTEQARGSTLQAKTNTHHRRAHQLDALRIGRVQEQHGSRVARTEGFFPHLAQQIAHIHRHIAKIDIHRARGEALVAHGAMVRHILELLPVPDADSAAGLLLVQECLHQQRGRQDLVARAVQKIGAWNMGSAHRFALATAHTVLHRIGDLTDVRLLHDQRLVPHQAEAWCVGIGQVGIHQIGFQAAASLRQQGRVAQQFALVETPLRVNALLVFGKRAQFIIGQELQLGNADSMLTGYHAIE